MTCFELSGSNEEGLGSHDCLMCLLIIHSYPLLQICYQIIYYLLDDFSKYDKLTSTAECTIKSQSKQIFFI